MEEPNVVFQPVREWLMVTKEQAQTLPLGAELHYTGREDCLRKVGPRGGIKDTVTRVRVSGACKVWKTRPAEFRLPVKYGLYESNAIDERNAEHWHLPEDCPADIQ